VQPSGLKAGRDHGNIPEPENPRRVWRRHAAVAIARRWSADRKALLMDEPWACLSLQGCAEADAGEINGLQPSPAGRLSVYVTTKQIEAMSLGRRIRHSA